MSAQLITAAALKKLKTLKVTILSKREKLVAQPMWWWCDIVVCDKELMHLVGESMGTFELIVIEHKQGLSHDQ